VFNGAAPLASSKLNWIIGSSAIGVAGPDASCANDVLDKTASSEHMHNAVTTRVKTLITLGFVLSDS
jgi:hypothetical protein